MIHQVFAVRDNTAEIYMSPWVAPNKGVAIRSFAEEVNARSESGVSKYPDQHVLFHLGSYDDETAKYDLLPAPVSLGVGIDYKKEAA